MAFELSPLREQCAQFFAATDKPVAVRRAKDDTELLVVSLPPLSSPPLSVTSHLSLHGYECRWDRARNLLFINPTGEMLERLFDRYPKAPPPLPKEDVFHPAYALCRLLFLHPTPVPSQPLSPIYRVLKLLDAAPEELFLRAIPEIHANCAMRLRQRSPLPSLMGPLLTNWLQLQSKGFGGASHVD